MNESEYYKYKQKKTEETCSKIASCGRIEIIGTEAELNGDFTANDLRIIADAIDAVTEKYKQVVW